MRCTECRRKADPPVATNRYAGGDYRRPSRWYHTTICVPCAEEIVQHGGTYAGARYMGFSVSGVKHALERTQKENDRRQRETMVYSVDWDQRATPRKEDVWAEKPTKWHISRSGMATGTALCSPRIVLNYDAEEATPIADIPSQVCTRCLSAAGIWVELW